jgi:arylsulfatase A-like enzyme
MLKIIQLGKILLVCLAGLILSGCSTLSPGKVDTRGCNVILVIIDDLRPDHLGCYGYKKNVSPAIDALAADSVLFENAFSQAPYTLPSTMSILTSVYPSAHGMFFVYKDKLSTRLQTMAEIFSTYQYHTAWFSLLKTPHLDVDIGFGRGFQDKMQLDVELEGRQELIAWIEKNRENKFFLAMDIRRVHDFFRFIRTSSKHKAGHAGVEQESSSDDVERDFYLKIVKLALEKKAPFNDPAMVSGHRDLFNGIYSAEKIDRIKQLFPEGKRQQLDNIRDGLFSAWVRSEAGKDIQSWINAYDETISTTDRELIKPLLRELKRLGLYDKTLIIITADHGEAFGEHNEYGHNSLIYEVNHIPLIIKMPYAQKGRRTKELAQGVDILPTALEFADIVIPHQAQGRSLARLIREENIPGPNEYAFEQGRNKSSIRSKEWRLILANGNKRKLGPKQLYNLKLDPQERNNVYYSQLEVASRMQNELDRWQGSLVSYKDEEYKFSPEIDKAGQERIRKTGYW